MFEEKLRRQQYDRIWREYCGFVDLEISEYMQIQNRLMCEQIDVWSRCGLGRQLLGSECPKNVEEFRSCMPLTTFDDYADVLLQKRSKMLPDDPVVWIQTTWEGGKHPIKQAPYTSGMLEVCKRNVMSLMVFSTSRERGKFSLRSKDKMLYGLAPLPYATGLFPLLIEEEIDLKFLPPVDEALKMSFGERNKKGFKLGLYKGLDLFFGMSSVISYITENFKSMETKGGSLKDLLKFSPSMMVKYIIASYRSRRDGVPMRPKDLFDMKGIVCAGTDTGCYKRYLEENWGCRPMEIAAGTEPTCIGTETWARNGLILFPDACFYEFIPEYEMYRNLDDPSYIPKTYLMDQVVANQDYELVVSVLKGGAFMRYRVGDVYRCVGTGNDGNGVKLPRFSFVDRVPTVIDIAGFTRITEATVADVVKLSGLKIKEWFARKEFNEDQRPFLHLYVEIREDALESEALNRQVLKEHLSVYFNYLDSDYKDLKRLLGMEPLEITILRCGTVDAYRRRSGKDVRRINASSYVVSELLELQFAEYAGTRVGDVGR